MVAIWQETRSFFVKGDGESKQKEVPPPPFPASLAAEYATYQNRRIEFVNEIEMHQVRAILALHPTVNEFAKKSSHQSSVQLYTVPPIPKGIPVLFAIFSRNLTSITS